MGRFNKIVGNEGEKISLGKEEFTLKPLNASDIEIFTNMKKGDDKEALISLVYKTMYNADETITREDINEMPLGLFQKVVDVVLRLNELDK